MPGVSATLLGEPYGTMILTLSVIGNRSGADLVGLSLVLGGLRHRFQRYNLDGAQAYLSVLLPLVVLGLILPRFTPSAAGGELPALQAVFLIGLSVVLCSIFLAIQTFTHSDIFQQPIEHESSDGEQHHHDFVVGNVPVHTVGLLAALLPKNLAVYGDFGIEVAAAPAALGGFPVAILVLTPEGLTAIRSARHNRLVHQSPGRTGPRQPRNRGSVGDVAGQHREFHDTADEPDARHGSPGAVRRLCHADLRRSFKNPLWACHPRPAIQSSRQML